MKATNLMSQYWINPDSQITKSDCSPVGRLLGKYCIYNDKEVLIKTYEEHNMKVYFCHFNN